jgi:hypothetical protein
MFALGDFFQGINCPNDLGEILAEYNCLEDCLGHFCGHWALFSQKHLVILTLDESVDTLNESCL